MIQNINSVSKTPRYDTTQIEDMPALAHQLEIELTEKEAQSEEWRIIAAKFYRELVRLRAIEKAAIASMAKLDDPDPRATLRPMKEEADLREALKANR